MHFIYHGDYIPDREVNSKIDIFQQYQNKSKSVWNMLKEKHRNDRKKYLDKEEERYKQKITGKRFEKEEKEFEQRRLKQI